MATLLRTLEPGWYGYSWDAHEDREWQRFLDGTRRKVLQRKTWSTREWRVALIEVRETVLWTPPTGMPAPAPKAMGTQLQDLTHEPDVSPGFVVMVEKLTGQIFSVFSATGETLNDVAGKLTSAASSGATLVYVVAGAATIWALFGPGGRRRD